MNLEPGYLPGQMGTPAQPQKDSYNARRRPGGGGYMGGFGVSGLGGGSTSSYGRLDGGSTGGGSQQNEWMVQYVRRLWAWEQMDFESCFDQMVALLGPSPATMNKVYKLAKFRKKTKNQWARDDPAFCLVQVGFLLVSTAAWGVAVQGRAFSLGRFVVFFLNDAAVAWLGGGIVLSGACAAFANARLIEHSVHSVAQNVEWLYAFDVHCNAFFVAFLLTHVAQFLLLPVLLAPGSVLATALSAGLWSAAVGGYVFVTHLGYRALPFLKHTELFLYPLAPVLLALVATVALAAVAGIHFNPTRVMVSFYFGG